MVIFSDGLSEAIDAEGEPFGEWQLIDVIQSSRGASAETVCDHLFNAVLNCNRGTTQVDDMTLIVSCRAASDGE